MRYEIVLLPRALQDLRRLDAPARSAVRNALEVHLRFEPTKVSRSRIKRLRGLAQPQYRLRIGELRVFYDVTGEKVEVLAILYKSMVEQWLGQAGRPS
jgi:mRNA interferase RelE/StbE